MIKPITVTPTPTAIAHFDKLTFRTPEISGKVENSLRENSREVNVRRGRPIRACDLELIVRVVCPNPHALQVLADQRGFVPNYAEPALDVSFGDKFAPLDMVDLFCQHFLQPRHGKMQVAHYDNGGFSTRKTPEEGERKDGHWFQWYGDRSSKVTDGPYCFRIEGRHQGMPALRRIGIHKPPDLLTFDHRGYWTRRLRFYQVDLERLGRWYSNRRGQRRRNPSIHHSGSFIFNNDVAVGSILYRVFAAHPDDQYRSLQQFVDSFGRGPFIKALDVAPLFHIVHIGEFNSHAPTASPTKKNSKFSPAKPGPSDNAV